MSVLLKLAFRNPARIELAITMVAAHCGVAALVPPIWNHPLAPLIATESYTA